MPPVMSKLANATDFGHESMSSSIHGENDISVYDSRLASVIFDAIPKLKLKQSQVNSKKKVLRVSMFCMLKECEQKPEGYSV